MCKAIDISMWDKNLVFAVVFRKIRDIGLENFYSKGTVF